VRSRGDTCLRQLDHSTLAATELAGGHFASRDTSVDRQQLSGLVLAQIWHQQAA
jgi:hypothetical protein